MPVNQLLVGSLTGMFLVNGSPAIPATLSERADWISPVSQAAAAPTQCCPQQSDSAQPVIDWMARLAANARHLAELQPGWDGPGSTSISPKLLSRALFYVESALKGTAGHIVVAPRLVPGGDDSVQIEWHTRRGELEFDMNDRGEATVWIRDHSSGAEFDGEDGEALALFYRWSPWVAAQLPDAHDVPSQARLVTFAVAA